MKNIFRISYPFKRCKYENSVLNVIIAKTIILKWNATQHVVGVNNPQPFAGHHCSDAARRDSQTFLSVKNCIELLRPAFIRVRSALDQPRLHPESSPRILVVFLHLVVRQERPQSFPVGAVNVRNISTGVELI